MQPELRQLRAFLAVADQGSANRAGAALFRAQSAVSRSIQKLEGELGVALLEPGRVRNAPVFAMLAPERRVRAFVALAEQHHMPSVAGSLGITQPAVSIAVRELEEGIGVALFERTARGMLPTPAGAALALRLKRALAEIRHAVADIASLRGITRAKRPSPRTASSRLLRRAPMARRRAPAPCPRCAIA